ncbi:Glu/Leu/Phe/Val dehydrogenase family protein [Paractinoplanes globisporus]|uniref:Glu/Leu/Phe/Val dehydrogenase dimerization domain-containing protein n=1 Tax=Paractinoplanes globisporus TaxID=113565 RepID=A0ABW6WHY5_9ACTN|nr:Glu/Leu/Phe/Val dehydrogenase family protein [Actinoplanes globisporus]
MFPYERLSVRRGPESGLPIIVAIHSTARGPAIGGCRLASYPDWRDGLADALRLSAAMTDKCALAGLPHGGGKTVVVAPPDLSPAGRVAAMHDVGTTIDELGGAYATGPDVGTGPSDMLLIGERTDHVFCRPESAGGSGDSSPATAAGTVAALRALCEFRFGSPDLSRRSFAILGLGRVGAQIARLLPGSHLVVSDIDESKRSLIPGAEWTSPEKCLQADVDVLVPAALGGVLTPAAVPALRCTAVAGPANNQLDAPATAKLLHDRGILWAPDAVVSAGGIIHATAVELRHVPPAEALTLVEAIGDTLGALLRAAAKDGIPPAEVAHRTAANS